MTKEYSNRLVNETSPYLLQHANNPIDWYPWGNKALEKAKNENKLLLISIGYSACHWCHVMEHESFEDIAVAELMNKYFVCIKVDREERPDVDQVYMQAVQLMTGQGGWPLNCFALPDGKPVYGGTYFNKNKWMDLLKNLAEAYKKDPKEFIEYGHKLLQGIESINNKKDKNIGTKKINAEVLKKMITNWSISFDLENGGNNRAPKFPMPHNYIFLLRYGVVYNDEIVLKHVNNTLIKMGCGGIYDQLKGGFARYSTDMEWKVPHFEKMLYDNAQLVSLYSEAYKYFKNDLFKKIVFETLQWIEDEMTTNECAFYSAIDADSEGEEGAYYIWEIEELKHILTTDFEIAQEIFCIDERGCWENDKYILLNEMNTVVLKNKYALNDLEFEYKVKSIKEKLLKERKKRPQPGTDDKILTSWNAMTCKGYLDAYKVFGNEKHLSIALQNLEFILNTQCNESYQLYHSYKEGKSKINGFLDDYCFLADTLITAYSITFDEKWLSKAIGLVEYVNKNFYNPEQTNYFFTDKNYHQLITRPLEVDDNVIPSTNSVMANVINAIGMISGNLEFTEIAKKMVSNVIAEIESYPSAYTNWAVLYLNFTSPFFQVVFSGKKAKEFQKEFSNYYLPNTFTIGCEKKSEISLLLNRFDNENSYIFVCENQSCKLPVKSVEEAIGLIQFNN
jgi:uncharacterized protein